MDEFKQAINSSRAVRWFVLVLVSLLLFGTYWFQDFMSGIKPLMESELGITSSQFGAIVQWTTLANVFGMIILGGIFLDKFGVKLSGLLFGVVTVIGSFLTALGASGAITTDASNQVWIMMIGRLLFGVGLETTAVLVNKTVVRWFKGYELALAMGVSVGFGRLGSTFATMFSVDIGGGLISPAFYFAATLVLVGFVTYMAHLIYDTKLSRDLGEEQSGEEDKFHFSDLLNLAKNRSFVFITLLCVAFYSAVFPFMQYAPDLLVNKFGFSLDLDLSGGSFSEKLARWFTNGPKVAGLIPLGTLFFTPIFGAIVDRKGRAASLMILGSVLLIFAHLALSVFNSVSIGYLGLLALGVAFSLVPAAMWPSVAKIVPESRLGTAYAVMFTIQNWGLSVFFRGIGTVVDWVNPETVDKMQKLREGFEAANLSGIEINQKMAELKAAGEIPTYDYTIPILLLVGLGVISVLLAFMLKMADKKQRFGLELPSGAKPE